jgi:hypothetical protein
VSALLLLAEIGNWFPLVVWHEAVVICCCYDRPGYSYFSAPIITRIQILQECVNLPQINIDYSSINKTTVQELMRENPRFSLTVLA